MARTPISHALLIRAARVVLFWINHRQHRREIDALRQPHARINLGTGAWKNHAVRDVFKFFAICGQPVGTVGGALDDIDCRACKRLLKKAGWPK